MRRPPTISRAGSSHSTNGGLPITSQCRASTRGCPRPPRKRSAEMIPVRVAQEKNTRNAADSTKRRHCGAHRMVTFLLDLEQIRILPDQMMARHHAAAEEMLRDPVLAVGAIEPIGARTMGIDMHEEAAV